MGYRLVPAARNILKEFIGAKFIRTTSLVTAQKIRLFGRPTARAQGSLKLLERLFLEQSHSSFPLLGSDPTWFDQKQENHALQNVSIQKASELSPSVKSAVEQLLGRPIEADEEVSVASVPPQQIPPSENRAVVAEKLEAFLKPRS